MVDFGSGQDRFKTLSNKVQGIFLRMAFKITHGERAAVSI